MSFHAKSSHYRSKRKIAVEKHGALFDMQLDVGRGMFELFARIFHLLEIDSVFLYRIDQMNPILIFQITRLVHVELARARRRPKKTFPKSCTFFIGPIDQPHCYRRVALVLGMNTSKKLNAGESIQTTIKPTAIGHRIDMSANEQRLV